MKNISRQKAYSIFLMIELARIANIINKHLEYDLTWAKGWVLSDKFEASPFNVDVKPEYECIQEFLYHYKENSFVRANLMAIDKNSSGISIRGVYTDSKAEFNEAVADFESGLRFDKYYIEIDIDGDLTPAQAEVVADHEINL